MATLTTSRQKAFLRKYSDYLRYFMVLASICVIVFTLPKQAKFRYEYDRGRIWAQKDLVSPYSFAILKTQQEIDNDRQAALHSVTPIYQLDDDVTTQALEGYKNDFEIKWHDAGLTERQKQTYFNEGETLLNNIYDKRLLFF